MRLTRGQADQDLMLLDKGEREAIQLAEQEHAEQLLLDDRRAYVAATRRGLQVTGTLGVLISADEQGLINAQQAYRRLVAETTFRTSTDLEARFLALIRSRR